MCSSRTCSYSAKHSRSEERSAQMICTGTGSSFLNSSIRFSRRATRISSQPIEPSTWAKSLPMPELAPVIKAFILSALSRFIVQILSSISESKGKIEAFRCKWLGVAAGCFRMHGFPIFIWIVPHYRFPFWVQFSTMLIWEKETGRRKLSGFRQAKLPNSLSGAMAQ